MKYAMCAVVSLLAFSLFACSTRFAEDHYFQSVNEESGVATNYFRLRVRGNATGSKAKYVAGYYDERAVDLFFDEVKTADSGGGSKGERQIFKADLKDPGSEDKIKPLSPSEHGKFVMILSSNAKAVADTIGSFAENEIVADAITNIVNRKELLKAEERSAELTMENAKAASTLAHLEGVVTELGGAENDAAKKQAALRMLEAIATALGSGMKFKSFEQAELWFQARQ